MTERTNIQLGPATGTDAWIRGSIDAMVLMRTYGLEVPINWEMPPDIAYLPPHLTFEPKWPHRAIWRTAS